LMIIGIFSGYIAEYIQVQEMAELYEYLDAES
jgi:hypothetical protein